MTTSPTSLRPRRLSYASEAPALVIEWDDDSVSTISFATLRQGCPCAICLGEMGRGGRFAHSPDLEPGEDDLADVTLVGAYGVNVTWRDGHATGIYTFAHLRTLAAL